jgi:hypothetical protein
MKRSGRDESIQVAIHMCMEAMLGISLYSYLYLKLAKTLYLIIAMSSLQQNWRQGQKRFCLDLEVRVWRGEGGSGELSGEKWPNICTYE